MITLPLRRSLRVTLVLIVIFGLGALTSIEASENRDSASSDLTTLAYEAFRQLAGVYRSGGDAPRLVEKLNVALDAIHEAQLKRMAGDEGGALALEEQARAAISEISDEIPTTQREAETRSITRALTVITAVPIVVALSTFIFYLTLRTWRWYEKSKLFEMRIVEKKKEED